MAGYLSLIAVLVSGAGPVEGVITFAVALSAVAALLVAARRWGHVVSDARVQSLRPDARPHGARHHVPRRRVCRSRRHRRSRWGLPGGPDALGSRSRAGPRPARPDARPVRSDLLRVLRLVDRPATIPPIIGVAVVLGLVTIATKVLTGWWSARREGIGTRGRFRAGVALVARGESRSRSPASARRGASNPASRRSRGHTCCSWRSSGRWRRGSSIPRYGRCRRDRGSARPADVARRRLRGCLGWRSSTPATRLPRSRSRTSTARPCTSPTSGDGSCSCTSTPKPTRPGAPRSPATCVTTGRSSPSSGSTSWASRPTSRRSNLRSTRSSRSASPCSDTDHAVAEAWGTWGENKLYGKTSIGITRSSFLIDEHGRVARAWYRVKADQTVPKAGEALEG